MKGSDPQMMDKGWGQVKAGVALIRWSRLASWDAKQGSLVAAEEAVFKLHHKGLHKEFGRLLCWIAFSVGAEYLIKGICLLNGHNLSEKVDVIRVPSPDEDIRDWVSLVIGKDPSICLQDCSFGMLGKTRTHIKYLLEEIQTEERERDLVLAGIDLLTKTIRNRDAHRYVWDVRGLHFHVVEKLFVPAFNILLGSLCEDEVRTHLQEL